LKDITSSQHKKLGHEAG